MWTMKKNMFLPLGAMILENVKELLWEFVDNDKKCVLGRNDIKKNSGNFKYFMGIFEKCGQ